MTTRRKQAMGPAKGKQRVLKSGLVLIASVVVAWVTWERSCILAIWFAIEGLFWVSQTFRYHKLNSMVQNPPTDDVQIRIEQFLTLAGVLDMKEFLSGWFMNVPYELLTRDDVLSFVAYGFWYEDRSEMSLEQQEEVKQALLTLESTFDFHVPDVVEGSCNKDLPFMCHLWEPLRVIHKPLVYVITMEASTVASSVILSLLGFSKYSTPTFTYWAKNVKKPIKLTVPARPLIVDTAPQDHDTPISEAIRRHSFTGSTVHRPSRTGEHWRCHQAALSSAGSRQWRQSLDGSICEQHTQEMGSLSGGEQHRQHGGSNTGNMAWSIWRNQNGGRNSFMRAFAGISLPSAREMNLLFGSKTPEQIPECDLKAASTHGAAASYSGLDEDLPREAKVAEKAPIVFLHGVGLGVLPYVGFIRKVLSVFSTGTPVIVPEIRHVSQRLVAQAQTVDKIVCELVDVLKRHQLQSAGAHFIAHSFGTFVLSHMLHLYPNIVKSALLCDPVCMLTCCPQLLRHFVYQDDTAGILAHLCTPAVMIKRMLGRDLIIAETFCRSFFWHKLMLWPCEFPPVTVVCLSYDDDLVPCELVQKQLKEDMQPQPKGSDRKLDVILSKGPHGAFLALAEIQDRMLLSFRDGIQQAYG